MSISPLDRLLNQKARDDEIRVAVSCTSGGSTSGSKDYDLNLKSESVNNIICYDGAQPAAGQTCQTNQGEALTCSAGENYKVELFDLVG